MRTTRQKHKGRAKTEEKRHAAREKRRTENMVRYWFDGGSTVAWIAKQIGVTASDVEKILRTTPQVRRTQSDVRRDEVTMTTRTIDFDVRITAHGVPSFTVRARVFEPDVKVLAPLFLGSGSSAHVTFEPVPAERHLADSSPIVPCGGSCITCAGPCADNPDILRERHRVAKEK